MSPAASHRRHPYDHEEKVVVPPSVTPRARWWLSSSSSHNTIVIELLSDIPEESVYYEKDPETVTDLHIRLVQPRELQL
uniref:Uncharacterized protein n=1 Tax=Leersia perrieri TaxID=77586 RepID=A0A0D9XHX6_9ORYZ